MDFLSIEKRQEECFRIYNPIEFWNPMFVFIFIIVIAKRR